MNRNELINATVEELQYAYPDDDWNRAAVKACLEVFEGTIEGALCEGETVSLSGFVKFSVKDTPAKKARDGINPFTKEPMRFKAKPASITVRAVALKALKDAVAATKKKR